MLDPNRWREKTAPQGSCYKMDANQGQKFLGLVRSLENEDDQRVLDQTRETLKMLITSCARRGLLQGKQGRAEGILSSSGGEGAFQDSLKKKRGRKRGDYAKNQANPLGDQSTATATTSDESLIVSAVIRVLSFQPPKLRQALEVVRMSADLCTAISEHIRLTSSKDFTRIGLAEYEVMSASGIPLLKGLIKASKQIVSVICNKPQKGEPAQPEVILDVDTEVYNRENATLQSCLKAAASLVSLFAAKLTRSAGLMSELQALGLTTSTMPCPDTQTASSRLLAALPLSGAIYIQKETSNKSIGEQWSNFLMDAVVCLARVLRVTMVPLTQKLQAVTDAWELSNAFEMFLERVKSCLQERMHDEEQRASAFRVFVSGLSQLIQSIIARDFRCPGGDSMLLDARVSMEDILSLLECMLSFSFASESSYIATKKRLRSEAMDGALLSPASTAFQVAGYVKLVGHRLFVTFVSAVGYPPLLPHSKRILRLVSKALVTSSSSAVQKAVDHAAAVSLDTKAKRWQHTSILLRSQAVQSFSLAISAFGLDPTRNNETSNGLSWLNSNNPSGAEDCLTVVGGCLLEQLFVDKEDTGDWGTFEERVLLAMNSVHALQSALHSCGGFMPLSLRLLVESIASASLDALLGEGSQIAFTAQVQVAILNLGSACVSTPWSSGASSSLREKLFDASLRCRRSGTEASSAALSALRLCESLATPRVPALYVDKQLHNFSGSAKPLSAESLMKEIVQAKDDLDAGEKQSAEVRKSGEEGEVQGKRKRVSATLKETPSQKPPIKKQCNELDHQKEDHPLTESTGKTDEQPKPSLASSKAVDRTERKPPLSEEEDEFLPGIVDDGGPDEGDA